MKRLVHMEDFHRADGVAYRNICACVVWKSEIQMWDTNPRLEEKKGEQMQTGKLEMDLYVFTAAWSQTVFNIFEEMDNIDVSIFLQFLPFYWKYLTWNTLSPPLVLEPPTHTW